MSDVIIIKGGNCARAVRNHTNISLRSAPIYHVSVDVHIARTWLGREQIGAIALAPSPASMRHSLKSPVECLFSMATVGCRLAGAYCRVPVVGCLLSHRTPRQQFHVTRQWHGIIKLHVIMGCQVTDGATCHRVHRYTP